MFNTKFGPRSLIQRYATAEFASTLTAPAVGQLVVLKSPPGGAFAPIAPLAPPTAPSKKTSGKKAKPASAAEKTTLSASLTDPDIGKLTLASAAASGTGELDGILVEVIAGAVFVARPGEEVPLWLFGTLAELQAFGDRNVLYLSEDTPGDVQAVPPNEPDTFIRRVARCPKFFSKLVAADLDPNSASAIYVTLIDEHAIAL